MSVNKKLLNNLDVPSGTSTPVFPWSPLPPRKKFGLKEQSKSQEGEANLYPNCDVNIWMRSCKKEIIEPINGKIVGKVPVWLKGALYRNGPGLLKIGEEQFGHLFDGSAHLHCFAIANENITYQCRFLQSDIYKKSVQANRIVMTEFGTKSVADPCNTIFHRVASIFNPQAMISDNAMISLYPFADELYAFGEGPIIHRVNKENLNAEERVDLYKHVGLVSHTSHPHVEHDGTVYNMGMTVSATGPVHNIVRFPKKKNSIEMFESAEIVARVPSRWRFHPSYMHTFGITPNYFIIVEQPLNLSVPSMMKCRLTNEPLVGSLNWYNEEMSQFNLVSRKTGECIKTFQAEAFFYLHIINQYEKDDTLVIDICAYRDPSMIDCMYIDVMKNMQQNPDYAKMFRGRPLRFILPLEMKTQTRTFTNSKATAKVLDDGRIFVKPEKLSELGCETPRVNYENILGKEYRYFYAISSDVDSINPGTVIKVDTVNKEYLTWCEENCYASEPIFVPNPNSKDEDDGVVLSSMVWGGEEDANRVGIIILNAKNLQEVARAEFITPSPVPKCLHGWYCPKQ